METRDLRKCVLPVNRMTTGPSVRTLCKSDHINNEKRWRQKCLKIPI